MAINSFTATIQTIGSWVIVVLPQTASAKLPSRGMVLIAATINGAPFKIVLEPDGKGSHWFTIDTAMQKAIGAKVGDTVKLEIEPSTEWPEPKIPADIKKALQQDDEAQAIWDDITPMARWDWIRWIRATLQPETRKRRVAAALSKLKHGIRRPCCFNRSMCTEATISKNGVLLQPGN